MPLGAYYSGHGQKVMRDMVRKHGKKKGESLFYATARKQGQGPDARREAKRRRARGAR